MLSRFPRALRFALAFACAVVALLTTQRASAGGICDASASSSEGTHPLDVCVALAVTVGLAGEDVPGFCDLRGASGIAPLPVRMVEGGTLGRGPVSCVDPARNMASLSDGRDIPAPGESVLDLDRVGVPTPLAPLAPPYVGAVVYDVLQQLALPRGFQRGIEHPPRS